MKIKTKKQLNLPQLIEWAWDNPKSSRNKRFVSENKEFPYVNQYVIFNEVGYAEIENSYCYGRNDLFTVEVEEEITEDTVIPKLVVNHRDTGFTLYENDYINNEFPLDSVQAFYILNTDKTMTLIWRDGRLIE
ncbi:hypothetical protein [Staphylococcus arlettae]|uniref:hypothetical protein n=1 Tax=Staphylococcus arlettae TaxID=29378 RepID=UPI002DBB2076|nr:hypothetical protein [Staphylococcus arlettae]MEB5899824.1 hypothetical protein [Staphylococcus arlettae]